MINIIDKKDCTGCSACVQRCPKQCITMHRDGLGFVYPLVDTDTCIGCNLCEKVCPVINPGNPTEPLAVYAAKNTDAVVRRKSSSGGVFRALAERTLSRGGVVFGARFDSRREVVHDWTRKIEGIAEFMGSKYVQSQIGNCFEQAERFLKEGTEVLFSGTPCQIAALQRFLRKDYGDKLVKVEVICHGVPSPRVWADYLRSLARPAGAPGKNTVDLSPNDIEISTVADISFRDKRLSWQKYGLTLSSIARDGNQNTVCPSSNNKGEFYEPLTRNLYLRGFLSNVMLRPSCFDCPARSGRSQADISLGDFWGVHRFYPAFYDSKGVSLVLCWSNRGKKTVDSLSGVDLLPASFANALRSNPAITSNAPRPAGAVQFAADYPSQGLDALRNYLDSIRPSVHRRALAAIKNLVRPVYFFLLRITKK